MPNKFEVEGRERSEEYRESEKPAIDQLVAMGYEFKSQLDLNKDDRTDLRQILLYARLKKAIERINPELDEDGVYDALDKIKEDSFPITFEIMDSNERIRAELVGLSRSRGLEPITVIQNFGEGNVEKTVKLFDFDDAENNDFLVTNQFQLEGLKEPIYPDIVIFVNGIPFSLSLFDEHDIKGVLEPFNKEIEELKIRHADAISFFSDFENKNDNEEIILKFESIDIRDNFEYAFKMFSKSLEAVMPIYRRFQVLVTKKTDAPKLLRWCCRQPKGGRKKGAAIN
jgi:type I site-specific restriction-modification system R (restriction) subunit